MRRSILAAALLALSACQAATDPDGLDPLADAGSFCDAVFDVLLTRQVQCGTMAEPYTRAVYPSYVGFCDVIRDSAEAGRLGFDVGEAEACIAALRNAPCAAADGGIEDEACDDPFVGKVPAGGACSFEGECAPETAGCAYDATCPGTCLAYGQAGASCDDPGDGPCAPHLFCGANGTCEGRLPVDSPCADLGGWDDPCAQGAYCDWSAVVPTCRALAREGESCADRSCDWNAEPELACGPSGRCVRVPVADGQPCESDWQCAAASFCEGAEVQDGTCKPRKESGSCLDDWECTAFARCVTDATGGNGSCRELARVGERCEAGENLCVLGASCAADFAGQEGSCKAWPEAGGTCGLISGELVGCTGAFCDGAADGIGTCRAWKATGQPCAHSRECGPEAEFGAWCDEETRTCAEPGLCAG